MMWTGHWLPILANYSQFISGFAIVGAVLAMWHKHNCHIDGCYRLQWHVDPVSGHPVCKRHHPNDTLQPSRERLP